MNNIMGIYKITNRINGKMYIGSSKNIFGRWKTHIEDLNLDKHHSYKLQRDWTYFNIVDFTFEVIEVVADKELLLDIEQKWMDYYQCYEDDIGYNVSISSKERKTKLSVKMENDKINKEKHKVIKPVIKIHKKEKPRNKYLDSNNKTIKAIAEHDVEFLRSKINYKPTYHILKEDCLKEIFQYDFSWFFDDSDIISCKNNIKYNIRNVIEVIGNFITRPSTNKFILYIFNMEFDEIESKKHDIEEQLESMKM